MQGLRLVEFSYGAVPPTLSICAARVRPREAALELEMNMDYESCGAHLVVDATLVVGGQTWPMRLNLQVQTASHLTDLDLHDCFNGQWLDSSDVHA